MFDSDGGHGISTVCYISIWFAIWVVWVRSIFIGIQCGVVQCIHAPSSKLHILYYGFQWIYFIDRENEPNEWTRKKKTKLTKPKRPKIATAHPVNNSYSIKAHPGEFVTIIERISIPTIDSRWSLKPLLPKCTN